MMKVFRFCLIFFLFYKSAICIDDNGIDQNVSESDEVKTTCIESFEPYPGDCNKFYICDNGHPIVQSCPSDLFWNNVAKTCDWQTNVKCDSMTSTTSESKCSDQFEPFPGDCSRFFICDNNHPVELSCPADLHWNNEAKTCDWPENAHCDSSTSPTQTPEAAKSHETSEKPCITERPEITPPTTTDSIYPPSQSITNEFKVVCYYTNWAFYRPGDGKFVPENIDGNLCTHIVFAFAVLDPNTLTLKTHDTWSDIDNKFYEKVTAFRKQGIKVLIALGGWNDSQGGKYGRLLLDAKARQNFITNALEFIHLFKFDGLDLDLEYPACWQNNCEAGRAKEKAGFAQFAQELSEAFKPRGLLLSAAVSASQKVIDAAYDVPKLAKYLDWIAMMTYDFHGSWDRKTGHNSPLYALDSTDHFNSNFTTHYWMQKGAPANKLVMGVASYGQSFSLVNTQNNGLNAQSSGPGEAGQYTRQGGMLSYYEICDKTKKNGWKIVRDPQNHIGPYAFKGNQWVSYDDVDNIRSKAKLMRQLELGGGMIWALDLDDFTGKCGCGKYPLLTALNQELRNIGGSSVKNCT